MAKKKITMNIVNAHAAGIDVGSRSHYVSINQQKEDVREFGVFTKDYEEMANWLKKKGITTIAMESTGNYWQTLFSSLQSFGFTVMLVNGRQIKNVKGKTDVLDCMWIQKLHSLGLLTGSFLPDTETIKLRTLYRHRHSLAEELSKMTNKMQKSLRLMNLRLDVILSDIMGKSGREIIISILNGVRSGEELALLADYRVKKTKEEITKSLEGDWNDELLYELKDCYDLYCTYETKISQVDKKIEELINEFVVNKPIDSETYKRQNKRTTKHQIKFDIEKYSTQYYGVNLFTIPGISHNTVLTLMSELGEGIHKFESAKQFASWLRLAPNNKVSGGKVISSKTPKGRNALSLALRNAANTIDNKKEGILLSFFKRIAYKKGRCAAITATARKLATIIWNMIHKQTSFQPISEVIYNDTVKKNVIKNLKKKMIRLGIDVSDLNTNFNSC
jgi:transposase